ncbi:MAG: glycosyltransferase, partial [Candidatus Jorgensenbacteria bacterium]|nr:glycosyltransferase [Candidatus Jorgensenbacteria bacterium]
MKILHLVLSYFPAHRHGGPIASVHAMNKALVAAGAEVTVYTTNIDGSALLDAPLGRPVVLDGVKVVYFPLTSRPWVYSRALHRALARDMANFDIVHITSVFLSASTLGAYYAKKFKRPYVISPRGSLMKEPLAMKNTFLKRIYLAALERKNLAGAAAIHFTTEKEKEEYITAGFPLQKSVVIPNAYEEEQGAGNVGSVDVRNKFGIPRNAPIVLSLGRITWKKGFDTLIPAFKKVGEQISDAVLVIAGNDEEGYQENVKALISNFKLEDSTIFTGMVLGAEK